jgi:hypothetical protein
MKFCGGCGQALNVATVCPACAFENPMHVDAGGRDEWMSLLLLLNQVPEATCISRSTAGGQRQRRWFRSARRERRRLHAAAAAAALRLSSPERLVEATRSQHSFGDGIQLRGRTSKQLLLHIGR